MDPRCFISGLPAHAASWPQRVALRRAAALCKPPGLQRGDRDNLARGWLRGAATAPGKAVPELRGVLCLHLPAVAPALSSLPRPLASQEGSETRSKLLPLARVLSTPARPRRWPQFAPGGIQPRTRLSHRHCGEGGGCGPLPGSRAQGCAPASGSGNRSLQGSALPGAASSFGLCCVQKNILML